mmetsp:Transcript_31330/g.83026  ORF Transcript_31330/g.83026 Transcript_31330/m.83026 type:complete len:281 (-) Transcript_31330:91-933(-)
MAAELAEATGASKKPWRKCPITMQDIDSYCKESVIDVMKMTGRPGRLRNVPLASPSDKSMRAKRELQADPFSMYWINELGCIYTSEGQHDQCLNVMLRGWKRAHEIEDSAVRFHFLMKISELSLGLHKPRQALAVLRDVAEPDGRAERKAYLLLSVQAWASNGDIQQALKAFNRTIEDESFQYAVRIFAIVMMDLKTCGAYGAAKSIMDQMAGEYDASTMEMLEQYVDATSKRKPPVKEIMGVPRPVFAGSAAFVALVVLYALYLLESWSLAKLKASTSR